MLPLNQPIRTLVPPILQTLSPTLTTLLQTTTDPLKLRQIHAYMIVTGIIQNTFAATQLLSSPALLDYHYASSIFSRISRPDLFTWNTIIKKLSRNNTFPTDPPLLIYKQMLVTGLRPNGHTFMYLIKALQDLREGEEVHANVIRTGFGSSEFVSGLVLWTAMIRAYACVELPMEAMELFRKMGEVDLMPDPVAMATVISACGLFGDLGVAQLIHGFVIKTGLYIDPFVYSSLLGTYGDSGNFDLAHQLFLDIPVKNIVIWNAIIHQSFEHNNLELAKLLYKSMPERDLVSWNTIIGGLSRAGESKEALALFQEMEFVGVKPNVSTLSSVLSACVSVGALDIGTKIDAYIQRSNFNSDGELDSSLIDMYSKCGNIEKAMQIFDKSPRKDIFLWTSIICGLATHGQGKEALDYFSKMQEAMLQPDEVTFTGVLNACAHAGLLDQGWVHFCSMEKYYNLKPKVEHYGCMIDLLGRMGRLSEAYELILEMPMEANNVVWKALLSACRVHKNVDLGEVAARRLLELDPSDSWSRLMLSNMYAEDCRWDGVMRLREEMKAKGLRNSAGCSSIEVNGTNNGFLIGEDSEVNALKY
ncbi:pentatricopeptide repeat-containing protein At3g12770-like [Cornus florida]|uniref:pentatricopeptide repeat-containing protein At3g12770-like n=1 Tax=Cornus florida TaxID=4283 RepID=UPI00289FCFD2|nr:pentatricopeptide repeat-containing protein At3g12770-like [Cornus florida]